MLRRPLILCYSNIKTKTQCLKTTTTNDKEKKVENERRRKELARAFMLSTTIHSNNELPLCRSRRQFSIGRET